MTFKLLSQEEFIQHTSASSQRSFYADRGNGRATEQEGLQHPVCRLH